MQKWLYCPVCRGSLVKKQSVILCKKCGWQHYKNPLPSVAGFIMNADDEILLIKRGAEPEKGRWALPSGFIEPNETPEQAVLRELKEETGLNGTIKKMLGIYVEPTRFYGDVLLIGYEIEGTGGKIRPGSDTTEVNFFSKNKLPRIPFLSHREIINQGINSQTDNVYVEVLKSKISEAVITDTILFYKGSMGIDAKIMRSAHIKPGEKVQVLNYDNGERLETYVIPEKPDSRKFILYGPASLKGKKGQRLCILSYAFVAQNKAEFFKPRIVILDTKNFIKKIKS
ncbi:MAG: aspartate 1-decarboxylase [bacterium]